MNNILRIEHVIDMPNEIPLPLIAPTQDDLSFIEIQLETKPNVPL